jgi:hypothetical protein
MICSFLPDKKRNKLRIQQNILWLVATLQTAMRIWGAAGQAQHKQA